MKILFLQFPLEPAWGGAETHTKILTSGLTKRGHEVFLLTSNAQLLEGTKKHIFHARQTFIGWEPTAIKTLLLFPLTSLIAFFILLKSLILIRPKILFCLTLTDKLIGTPLAFCFGAKVVWIEHTRLGKWFYKNPLLPWYKYFAQNVKIITPSYFLRNQMIGVGIPVDNVSVIYPGVAKEKKLPTRPFSPQITLGYLGRLTPEKGVGVLIQASVLLKTPHNILIGGTGPNEQALKELTRKLRVADKVNFLGSVSDKTSFFREIDILIVPSILAESFGLVITEAMAAGVAVIASRIGGIPEIIQNKKNGLLVEPGSPDELSKAIIFLAENSSLKQILITAGLHALSTRFNSERMVGEYLSLIEKFRV
ncbi:MAG: glycosyltransferase family 4 protein [bacterium]|nr:glycosyltransferase family 4 protein [bacterium]